jgi:hypothetical protein
MTMGDNGAQPKVANPYLASLKRLKNQLQTETEVLKKQLETAAKDMDSKKVWVGKAATGWGKDIKGRRSRMKVLVEKLIPAVDAEIAKCPEKVTPGEAKMMNMDLQGRVRQHGVLGLVSRFGPVKSVGQVRGQFDLRATRGG